MVLDFEAFRKQVLHLVVVLTWQEDPNAVGPDQVRENQRKRHKDVEVVQKISDVDEVWRKSACMGVSVTRAGLFAKEAINRLRNLASNHSADKRKVRPIGVWSGTHVQAGEKPVETEELPKDLPADISTLPHERLLVLRHTAADSTDVHPAATDIVCAVPEGGRGRQ